MGATMNMVELIFPFSANDTGPVPAAARREPSARSWKNCVDELLRIRNFQDDWDGEGSPAPSIEVVDGAMKLARTLDARGVVPAHRVAASVNGTIH